jgi:hypothetical protein
MTRIFKTKKELAERLMAGEKWRVRNNNGEWLMPDFMDTEDEIRRSYPLATQFKRMDILGSEEVVL